MIHEIEVDGGDIRRTPGPILRVGIAGLPLVPGVSKFPTYDTSVRSVESLGLPAPGVVVPIVGGLDLLVALSQVLDRAPGLAASLVVPIVLVAAVTAGRTWQALGVLAGAFVRIGLETPEVGAAG